jgi:hypothetical protein
MWCFEQLERRREEDELKQIKQQEEHFERVKVFYILLCIN